MHFAMTVIEGKKKLDFSDYYEIQLLDMRKSKAFNKELHLTNPPYESYNQGCFWNLVDILKSSILPLFIISSLSLLIVLVSFLDNRLALAKLDEPPCFDKCRMVLVESIPENLTYPEGSPVFPSTYHAWKSLLRDATKSIDLAVFYWSLKNEDVTPIKMHSAWQGEDVLQDLLSIGKSTDVKIRVAQNAPTKQQPQNDSKLLEQEGAAEVRSLDFNHLVGAGVLHTKMWIVDGKHLYLGSANMDWQSLTQVKETGIWIQNCSCLAQDMMKVFEVYWLLGNSSAVPSVWPKQLETKYNLENQMRLSLPGQNLSAFISSSPLPFNPAGRTNDVDAIVAVIRSAKKFIHIAVMDYFPRMIYSRRQEFWPVIDSELRRAALDRKVRVRVLASHWNHTRADMVRWLRSLQDISGPERPEVSVETKLFVVPAYTDEQKELRFARVNHNKYMVTDQTAYIGTSNWSGDYFTNTGGVSLSITESEGNGTRVRDQLAALFERDWLSSYASPVA